MNVFRQAIKHTLAGLLPRERFLMYGPRRRASAQRGGPVEIALTFDDGPHPQWTPAVLEALSEAGWKGTFFVIGELAERFPALVRRIVDEGHVLGNHTYTHAPPSTIGAPAFLDEVRRTSDLIERLTGTTTTLVRPPLGKLTWQKCCSAWKAGHSLILWNVDPQDFAMRDITQARTWAESYGPAHGDVILLHDRLPYAATMVRVMHEHGRNTVRAVALSEWFPASGCASQQVVATRK